MTHSVPQDMSSQGVPEVEQEPIQDWYFTFAYNHTHPVSGESLGRSYVVINATERDALRAMREAFGDKWAHCYPTAKSAGAEEYGLQHIPLPVSGAVVEERTEECPTCDSPKPAEHPVVTLDDGGNEDGEIVDRCLNPWHVFTPPSAEQPLGGAAALRADVVTSVLEEVEALRRDMRLILGRTIREALEPGLARIASAVQEEQK